MEQVEIAQAEKKSAAKRSEISGAPCVLLELLILAMGLVVAVSVLPEAANGAE
jgi:hypothetical protein